MARVSIDDEFMTQLQTLLGKENSPARVTEDALALLKWAASEVKSGRTILSSDASGKDLHKLAMPSLLKIQPPETK